MPSGFVNKSLPNCLPRRQIYFPLDGTVYKNSMISLIKMGKYRIYFHSYFITYIPYIEQKSSKNENKTLKEKKKIFKSSLEITSSVYSTVQWIPCYSLKEWKKQPPRELPLRPRPKNTPKSNDNNSCTCKI